MIKAFAPMLGEFRGRGCLADGTEVVGKIEGTEALANVAYAFKARMEAEDGSITLMDSFFVLSCDLSGKLRMDFHDTREHLHRLERCDAEKGDLSQHVFRFQGERSNGTSVRISFALTSAEECHVSFESKKKGGQGGWREHWKVELRRVMTAASTGLRAA